MTKPSLSAWQLDAIVRVQDPTFYRHRGIEWPSPLTTTTITQSLVKRVFFEEFRPGFQKVEQTLVAALVVDPKVGKDAQLHAFAQSAYFGHVCRSRLQARWLRIHSLPDAKRYPDTEVERLGLVRRQRDVFQTLFESRAGLALFASRLALGTDWHPSHEPDLAHLGFEHLGAFGEEEDDRIVSFSTRVALTPRAFDELILTVADERVTRFRFADLEAGTAYAPCDGGADLFYPNVRSCEDGRRAFEDWLSARPNGL